MISEFGPGLHTLLWLLLTVSWGDDLPLPLKASPPLSLMVTERIKGDGKAGLDDKGLDPQTLRR